VLSAIWKQSDRRFASGLPVILPKLPAGAMITSQKPVSGYVNCFRHSPEMYLIAGASRVMGLDRQIQIGRPLRLARYRELPSAGYRSNKLPSARRPFRSSTGAGYIDKPIVAAAVGANGSASLGKTGCQGNLLRGEVLFIEVDAKALNPLKTTSIHNAARMVESCATNPIRGGPARKPT
jgi:hypothetical protein